MTKIKYFAIDLWLFNKNIFAPEYYTSADVVKEPQGIDVAPFRDVLSQDELKKAENA